MPALVPKSPGALEAGESFTFGTDTYRCSGKPTERGRTWFVPVAGYAEPLEIPKQFGPVMVAPR